MSAVAGLALIGTQILAQPVINWFTPNYGTYGDNPVVIRVAGLAGFGDVTAVYFNTQTSHNYYVAGQTGSEYLVNASIPQAATTGLIGVRNAAGIVGWSSTPFTVFGPGPRPLSFSPASGRAGQAVIVLGGDRFLRNATSVFFKRADGGETQVSQLVHLADSNNLNWIQLQVPADAASGPIRVATSAGSNYTTQAFEVIKDIDLGVSLVSEPQTGVVSNRLDLVTTIQNHSSWTATGIIATNRIDPSFSYVSGTITGGTGQGGTPTHDGSGLVTSIIGDLAPGMSSTIRLITLPTKTGSSTNTAGFQFHQPDPNTNNNHATLVIPIISNQHDVGITMTAEPASVYFGEPMAYTITVRNRGPLLATAVQVSDIIPAGLNIVTVTTSQGFYQINGNSVAANLGNLPVNATAQLRITTTVNTRLPFSNTATVSANEPDPDLGNNSVTLNTTPLVREADLSVSQLVQPNPPQVGTTVQYVITVANKGPEAATQVNLASILSDNIHFLNASTTQGTVERNGGFVIAELGGIAAANSAKVTLNVIHKTTLFTTNQVDVTALEEDPVPADNRSVMKVAPFDGLPLLQHAVQPNGNLLMTWPAYPAIYRLQSKTNLHTSTDWSNAPGTPAIIDGYKQLEVNPAAEPSTEVYYRLTN